MKERLSKILNNPIRVPISIGVVAFGAGVGLGYFLGRRVKNEVHVLPNQLDFNLNDDDLSDIRDYVEQKKTATKFETSDTNKTLVIENHDSIDEIFREPDEKVSDIPVYETRDGKLVKISEGQTFVAEKIKEAMTTTEEVVEKVVKKSIFANDNEWNYAKEIKKRKVTEPYIIHKDEFYSEEKGYTQSTFTYYAGDNILCDEDDSPVYNHDDVTGPLQFGHGSGDPNVVHIRNDKRKAEYEILYDPGLYSVDVLGLDIENNERARDIKHSKNERFRLE